MPTSGFFPYPCSDFLDSLSVAGHRSLGGPVVARLPQGTYRGSLTVKGDPTLAVFPVACLGWPWIYFGALVRMKSFHLTGKAWPLQAGLVCPCWENLLLLPEPRGQGISSAS